MRPQAEVAEAQATRPGQILAPNGPTSKLITGGYIEDYIWSVTGL